MRLCDCFFSLCICKTKLIKIYNLLSSIRMIISKIEMNMRGLFLSNQAEAVALGQED